MCNIKGGSCSFICAVWFFLCDLGFFFFLLVVNEVEFDCLNLVYSLKEEVVPLSPLGHCIFDILDILDSFSFAYVNFVPWGCN